MTDLVQGIIEIRKRSELVSYLCRNCDVIEITLIVVVVRGLRTDGSSRKNRQFAIEKIESDAAVKRDAIVVILDAGINAPRNSGIKIEPLGRMKGRHRAGVIKRNSNIKNVGM